MEFDNLMTPEGVTTSMGPTVSSSKCGSKHAARHNETERRRVKDLNRLFERIHLLLRERGLEPKNKTKRAISESIEEYLQL